MSTKQPRCPTCKKNVDKEGNDSFPFCSERCRLQDLGKWLNNAYTIPGSSPDRQHDGLSDFAEELIE